MARPPRGDTSRGVEERGHTHELRERRDDCARLRVREHTLGQRRRTDGQRLARHDALVTLLLHCQGSATEDQSQHERAQKGLAQEVDDVGRGLGAGEEQTREEPKAIEQMLVASRTHVLWQLGQSAERAEGAEGVVQEERHHASATKLAVGCGSARFLRVDTAAREKAHEGRAERGLPPQEGRRVRALDDEEERHAREGGEVGGRKDARRRRRRRSGKRLRPNQRLSSQRHRARLDTERDAAEGLLAAKLHGEAIGREVE
mmetsp:Transcript_38781/g.90658  ORF Transcript_38781/g.90658 Transcript_38781/m.90658 type:complete len:260 (-) Transcript_38781:1129-1908(-)